MKRLSLLMSGLILAASIALAGNPSVYNSNVTVSTSGVMLADQMLSRKYFLMVNEDTNATVYLATATISSSTISSMPNIPISPNFGSYEDSFYVYVSTWYACTDDGTAIVHVMEKD